MNTRLPIVCALTLASISFGAQAGLGAWTSAGPLGGATGQLITVPTNPAQMYVLPSNAAGLLRSTDSGSTWANVPGQLESVFVSEVAAHPTIANRIFLMNAGKLWVSNDAGATLVAIGAGLPLAADLDLVELTLDPGSATTLYVGTFSNGLYRSTNSGASFLRIGTGAGGYPGTTAGTISIDPSNPNRLLVSECNSRSQNASSASPSYLSTDGGTTFSAASATPAVVCLNGLTFSPNSAGLVLASSNFQRSYRSTNSGLSFTEIPQIPAPFTTASDFSFAAGVTYAATPSGGFRSTDNGLSWTGFTASITANGTQAAELVGIKPRPGTPATLVATTGYGGIWRSVDSGTTWARQDSTVRLVNIRSIQVNPGNPNVLIAGNGESSATAPALYRSVDRGTTWARSNAGLSLDFVRALTIDANTATAGGGGTVFAVGRDLYPLSIPPAMRASPLARSTDGGINWTHVDGFVGLTPLQRWQLGTVRNLVLDPTSGLSGGSGARQIMYLTASGSANSAGCSAAPPTASYNVGRLWKSIDGGSNWNRLDTPASGFPQGECVVVDPAQPTLLQFSQVTPIPMVINPATPSTLYVGVTTSYSPFNVGQPVPTTPGGVFKSTDGGTTWVQRSNGLPRFGGAGTSAHFVLALAIDPTATNTLYAAVNPLDGSGLVGGIYKTTDGGLNWSAANNGIVGQDIRALAVDPLNSLRVYAASGGGAGNPGGTFVSTNGGATWASFSTALPATSATALTIDNSTLSEPTIHVGSASGVYSFTRVSDLDADGPGNLIEGSAPGGDGNEDGQLDGNQSNVASIPGSGDGNEDSAGLDEINTGVAKMTLTITPLDGACTQIFDAYSPKASAVGPDLGRNYPLGLVRLEISNCRRAFLSVRFFGATFNPSWAFRSYGPAVALDPNTVQWNPLSAGYTGNTWTLELNDQAIGDNRSQANAILFIGGAGQLESIFANGFQ